MPKNTRDYDTEDDAPVLRFEDAEFDARRNAEHARELKDSELQFKQEELLRKRIEFERAQREAEELENRRNKEHRFNSGRRQIVEQLNRSLSKLEREFEDCQRAAEEILQARENYQQHLQALRNIKPEAWNHDDLNEDLERAIGIIENAEDDFEKFSRRLQIALPNHEIDTANHPVSDLPAPQDFKGWLMLGLAFSLPLIIALLFVVLLLTLFL